MLRDEKEMKDVVYAIVILASKCEEIHGNIDTLIKKLPESNKESILNYESDMFEALDYNFHFPSLYLRMYGILAILQEKGIIRVAAETEGAVKVAEGSDDEGAFIYDGEECIVPCINKLWASSVRRMDKVLLLDKESYKEIELVYAGLHLPYEIFNSLDFPFNQDNVTKLRNACGAFQFLG
ncbi:nucleotide excision repair factor TFIIH/TFIIKsubunit cyclin H-like protein [Encephalitozoon romaleae SJ-2008]|uniref:Nucleotide excision repair factor TFIIH/TFIIKsubunit cyclin H-like protein n=1 Tax=Encephalitozoon romaleae (strain SJ-2008) TaxID=1178016 RepID=I6ZVN2_ENCRO|nr:nucleotide excision repair factor TFIIH/TFIIKsubunit cyclin H-like protein [Encephalitozoon romaleae SJ-2008]AFN83801.1 nucleotide excision repair factor TFIIH/TFIIKsubunit cyclin H-like protein [Encephalitozoon romaleae SJ-2008]